MCDGRLLATASLAAVAPYEAEGLVWPEGMGEENHAEFGKALEGEEALRSYLEREAEEMRNADPEDLRGLMATLLGDQDRAVLTGRFAAYMIECGRHGLRWESEVCVSSRQTNGPHPALSQRERKRHSPRG